MKACLLGCLLLVPASEALAHRLDEYLQATRVLVGTNRVDLSLDLTPGVAIVDQLLVVIDKDRDGQVSENEATAYAQSVLKDIRVGLDEKALTPRLVDTSFPKLAEMRSGLGIIRIKATVVLGQLTAGQHTLGVTNAHLPTISVYLVNALVPKDPSIEIGKQTRDEFQKEYRLEFKVKPSPRRTLTAPPSMSRASITNMAWMLDCPDFCQSHLHRKQYGQPPTNHAFSAD